MLGVLLFFFSGSFGVVFKCTDLNGKKVALKRVQVLQLFFFEKKNVLILPTEKWRPYEPGSKNST